MLLLAAIRSLCYQFILLCTVTHFSNLIKTTKMEPLKIFESHSTWRKDPKIASTIKQIHHESKTFLLTFYLRGFEEHYVGETLSFIVNLSLFADQGLKIDVPLTSRMHAFRSKMPNYISPTRTGKMCKNFSLILTLFWAKKGIKLVTFVI